MGRAPYCHWDSDYNNGIKFYFVEAEQCKIKRLIPLNREKRIKVVEKFIIRIFFAYNFAEYFVACGKILIGEDGKYES